MGVDLFIHVYCMMRARCVCRKDIVNYKWDMRERITCCLRMCWVLRQSKTRLYIFFTTFKTFVRAQSVLVQHLKIKVPNEHFFPGNYVLLLATLCTLHLIHIEPFSPDFLLNCLLAIYGPISSSVIWWLSDYKHCVYLWKLLFRGKKPDVTEKDSCLIQITSLMTTNTLW